MDAIERPSVNTSVDVMCGLSDLIIAQNFLGSDWTVAKFEKKEAFAVQSLETISFLKVLYLNHQSLHFEDLKRRHKYLLNCYILFLYVFFYCV